MVLNSDGMLWWMWRGVNEERECESDGVSRSIVASASTRARELGM